MKDYRRKYSKEEKISNYYIMDKKRKFKHLTFTDRLTIERMNNAKMTAKEIAIAVGCNERTIYYELKRATYEHLDHNTFIIERKYNPDAVQEKYNKMIKQKGFKPKIISDKKLQSYISDMIHTLDYSPEAILSTIKNQNLKFDVEIKSVNTIYKAIRDGYIEGVSMKDLPRKNKHKKRKKKVTVHAKLPPGTSIEKRPYIINERKTFGHWEMDCVAGKRSNNKILLVLTERLTRMEIVEPLKKCNTKEVIRALNRLEKEFKSDFYKIFKSITVDNGKEFKNHIGMEKALYRVGKRTVIYYCHPNSPQERGSNENCNHLVRRKFPKGIDMDKCLSKKKAKDTQWWINTYPRRMFKGRCSLELFSDELKKLNCKYVA